MNPIVSSTSSQCLSRREILRASTLCGVAWLGCPFAVSQDTNAGPGPTVPLQLKPAYPVHVEPSRMRRKVRELLGVEKVPPEIVFKAQPTIETDDGLACTKLTYQNMLGESVPGTILTPVDAVPNSLPGVICMPGTSGTAAQLTGPELRRKSPGKGALIGWARELSRRGFATLSLTLKGTESRRGGLKFWETQARHLAPYGRTLMGVMVDEALRGMRILSGLETVDQRRIGMTGMSLGGNVTWYATACESAIKVSAPVCGGVGSLRRQILEGDRERHSSYFYVPHLLRYFDHPQIVASCVCPRPFLMVAPTQDEDMPRSGVEELMRVVGPAYEAAGQAERFQVLQPESNHTYTVDSFKHVSDWFQKYC